MRITILNGNPQGGDHFDAYLQFLSNALQEKGHAVTTLTLREMKIVHCGGCWGCWVKTPGECVAQDDSAQVCRATLHSDLTLLASPVIMGFPSALLKKTCDKLIPLVHPYVTLVQEECHHVARYDHYPRLALLLEKRPDTDEEDIQIIRDIFARTALNLKTDLAFTRLTSDTLEEVAHEIDRL